MCWLLFFIFTRLSPKAARPGHEMFKPAKARKIHACAQPLRWSLHLRGDLELVANRGVWKSRASASASLRGWVCRRRACFEHQGSDFLSGKTGHDRAVQEAQHPACPWPRGQDRWHWRVEHRAALTNPAASGVFDPDVAFFSQRRPSKGSTYFRFVGLSTGCPLRVWCFKYFISEHKNFGLVASTKGATAFLRRHPREVSGLLPVVFGIYIHAYGLHQ